MNILLSVVFGFPIIGFFILLLIRSHNIDKLKNEEHQEWLKKLRGEENNHAEVMEKYIKSLKNL